MELQDRIDKAIKDYDLREEIKDHYGIIDRYKNGDLNFDYGDEKGKVDPVDSKDKSSSVTPVKKSRNNLQQRRRRRRTIVQVNNQSGGGSNTTTSSGGTNTKYVKVGNTSEKTLLDLQSLNNKQN